MSEDVDAADDSSIEHTPLLSVIVPVYNGADKIESTLHNIQSRIDQLESVMWNVELERSNIENSLLRTGQLPPDTKSGTNTAEPLAEQPVVLYAGGTIAPEDRSKMHADLASADIGRSEKSSQTSRSASSKQWYEIILVNDGSKDDTRTVINRVSENDKRIRLISYSVNMGKGYAIKQGVLHSNGRYIIFMDGDGDISSDILAKYLQRLSKVHIVIGSKNHRRSVVRAPASRRFLSKCFQLYTRKLIGLKLRDTQVGLKAGRGEAFRKIFAKVQVRRYAFDAEMLAIADLMDLKVAELPVKIDLDKPFKKKEIARMAFDIIGVAFRLRVIKWYQKNMEKKRPQFRLSVLF